jgi:BolA protein
MSMMATVKNLHIFLFSFYNFAFAIAIGCKMLRKMSTSGHLVQKTIEQKLSQAFTPITHLSVINESFMHNVPKGSETHFKVIIVSEKFTGMSLVERHRGVMDALKFELENGVHALSIQAKTPEQWSKSTKIDPSPNCLGGMKKQNLS